MIQNVSSGISTGRRCSQCGTRVIQKAKTCYFCGQDMTTDSRPRRSITRLDVVLIFVLLSVVVLWWQFGGQADGNQPTASTEANGSTESVVTQWVESLLGSGRDAGNSQAVPVRELLPTALPDDAEKTIQTLVDATPLSTAAAAAQQPTAIPPSEPASFIVRHQVRAGETLLAIATQYAVTVEDIQATNGLPDTLIRVGDELVIPITETTSPSGTDTAGATVSTSFNYTVKPDDTLISIAVRFGTHVAAIQEANDIGTYDFIQPGQTIQIPIAGVPTTVLASSEAVHDRQPAQPYASLHLLGPDDDAIISRSEDVQFRWVSIGRLQPNEWYVLHIWVKDGLFDLPLPVWTKATSFHLITQWAPPAERAITYGWQISVVRVLPDTGAGHSIEAASTPSEVRNFSWQ